MATYTTKRRHESQPAQEVPPISASPTRSPSWPLLAGIGILWAVLIATLVISLGRNEGHLSYGLDDAYIHMAIAKNIVQHGVWGVTPYEFGSASSSYLWTIVLSLCYLLTGVHDLTPLLLNFLFSTLILVAAFRLLRDYALPGWYVLLALVCIIFLTPLAPVSFTGMEHMLHALLVLLFLGLASREIAREQPVPRSRTLKWLYILVPLLVLARLESLAAILVVSLLFCLRKRWLTGVIMLGLSVFTLLMTGMLSRAFGGLFLPNSVYVKAVVLAVPSMAGKAATILTLSFVERLLAKAPELIILLLAGLVLLVGRALILRVKWWESRQFLLTVFPILVVLQAFLGDTGWFYRYEAYLETLAAFTLVLGAYDLFAGLPRQLARMPVKTKKRLSAVRAVLAIVLIVGLLPLPPFSVGPLHSCLVGALTYRIYNAHHDTPVVTTNIYQQQVQMGKFLRTYYNTSVVAANDIGAITYFTRIHLVDLAGLGSTRCAREKQKYGVLPRQIIDQLAGEYGARIAIVYDAWFNGLPRTWVPVAQWKIENNRICGSDIVTFYAIDPSEAQPMAAHLREFKLPDGVGQAINPAL